MAALPVAFLVADATGTGGLARTVVATANRVGEHRETALVSLVQRHERATYPCRVPHQVLVEDLSLRTRLLRRRRSELGPAAADGLLDAATDLALRRWLTRLPPSVLVTTRPSLHLAAATWAPPHVRLVGWDHKNFRTRYAWAWLGRTLDASVPALDAWVVLTRADAEDYRRRLSTGRIEVIRNALTWPVADDAAPLAAPVILGAGRLARSKGFGRMIEAFATVAAKHPDWQLHLHGEGDRRPALERRVERLGLVDRVLLPGHASDLRTEMRGAAVFAMSSTAEGFPMVLLEAMSQGLPLVSMDCPRGPGEIVDHDRNGLLVPDGDLDGFSRALLAVVEDVGLRRRLGAQAREDARRYDPSIITVQWLDLLEEVAG